MCCLGGAAETIVDHIFGADIDAVAAEDALAVFHFARGDHRVDVQAHRATAGAFLALDTLIGVDAGVWAKLRAWRPRIIKGAIQQQ